MISLPDAESVEALGAALAPALHIGDVVALFGDLGAGKTSFARGVLRGLGFVGDAPSPTFPILLTYDPPELRLPIIHADLYRIEGRRELAELALDEARTEAALLIEWPERLGDDLWPDALKLHFQADEALGRALTADVPPAWEGRWPPR